MIEQKIVYTALDNLQKNTHIIGKWQPISKNNMKGIIALDIDNTTYKVNTEIRGELRNYQLQKIEEIAATSQPFLLVTNHIFPKIKEHLRNKNIGYLEANGDIFFKTKDKMVWVEIKYPSNIEKVKVNRAFTKTGLRIVFHFLLKE